VFEAFHRLSEQGTTIIIVTHDRELVKEVPKIFEFSDGVIGQTTIEAAARRRTQELQALRLAQIQS
jgi:ABC-type lipoprotein export system ATPase subunit